MTALLSLEGVVAGYGRGDILCGVDLTVEQGSVMCLVGPNGAGKSTVLRVVSGLLRPREGRVVLDGEEISRLSPAQVLLRGVVHVAQEPAQDLQHRRLTGTVRPDETGHRLALELEVDASQDVAAPVAGDDALDLQQCAHPPR